MDVTSQEIREKFLKFFENKGHTIVPSSSLIPQGDPSVLLTTAGMQQFKPYYTGALDPVKDIHPGLGKPIGNKNAVSIQKSFRTSDIDEVGDDTHLTFFEMLGNFSFGGYGKKEAIAYAYEFITSVMGLRIDYVSVFEGQGNVPTDQESEKIWKEIDSNLVVRRSGKADNFWGPTGDSGPCGPTTEIYINGVEIWNIVFNEFYQDHDGKLKKLDVLGVDTGMGLERLALVSQNVSDIFQTDLFSFILLDLDENLSQRDKRIIADHVRAITFLLTDSIMPSNKEAGYILRRLMRRIMIYRTVDFTKLFNEVIENYKTFYPGLNKDLALLEFAKENVAYENALSRGEKEVEKLTMLDGQNTFNLSSTFGIPLDNILDIAKRQSKKISSDIKEVFNQEVKKHQDLSRTASAGTFKGGLVDHEPRTIRHHTAHHLLLAALRQVLGNHVWQRGSNVSSERLRLDFSHPERLTSQQLKQVEDIVNQKVSEGLEVKREEMPKAEAEKLGALAEFGAKYGDIVSVYSIYNKDGSVFSREFCGGPHVTNTSEVGKFKIVKEEASSSGVRRIKASVD